MKIIYLSLLLLGAASAFKVTKVSPSQVKVKQGGTFKVTCTVDYWYEVSKKIFQAYEYKSISKLKMMREFLILTASLNALNRKVF